MGFFADIFKKNREVLFTKVEEEQFILSNQTRSLENPSKDDLKIFLNCLFDEEDQFITLSLPIAKNGVRYMQACVVGTDIMIQLGLEEKDNTRLVERVCVSTRECVDIFYQFYDFGTVEKIEEYQPVRFL